MKEEETYKKIYLKYRFGTLTLFAECILLIAVSLACSKNMIHLLENIILSTFIVCLSYKAVAEYMKNIVAKECDLLAYKNFLEYLVQKKRAGNKSRLYIGIAKLDVGLGEFDGALAILGDLKKREEQLSETEKLNVQYLYVVSLEKSAKEYGKEEVILLNMMENFRHVKKREFQEIKDGMRIRKRLESCEWNRLISELGEKKPNSLYEQVANMYLLGMCYFKIGDYENAWNKFKFVEKWGGNTRYVRESQKFLKEIPVRNIAGKSDKALAGGLNKTALYITAALFFALVVYFNNGYAKRGDSVEGAYRLEFHISGSEPVNVVYRYKDDNYEIAVLWDRKYLSYCLMECIRSEQGEWYKICDSYRLERDFLDWEQKTDGGGILGEGDFFIDSSMENHVNWMIKRFYKSSDILRKRKIPCIGASCNSDIERLEIAGKGVEIVGEKEVEGRVLYIWKAEDVDYERVDYSDISISR